MLASKSGKFSSDLAVKWFVDTFLSNVLSNVSEASALCLDSWTGQMKEKFDVIDKHSKSQNFNYSRKDNWYDPAIRCLYIQTMEELS